MPGNAALCDETAVYCITAVERLADPSDAVLKVQLPPGCPGRGCSGRFCTSASPLSFPVWLCCSVAAERHQGKPVRKRKRDEDDAAEDDIASSDEEAEIGEGFDQLWAAVIYRNLSVLMLSTGPLMHSRAHPADLGNRLSRQHHTTKLALSIGVS